MEWQWKKAYYRIKHRREEDRRIRMRRMDRALMRTASPLENKVAELETEVKKLRKVRPRVIYVHEPKPDRFSEKEGYL